MKLKGYLLAISSAVFYGLIPLFVLPLKAVKFPMDETLFYRFGISAFMILVYLMFKRLSLALKMKELLIVMILGLLFALSSELLFIAYDFLSPGIASTILFVYPVIVALLMALLFREKISSSRLFALLITMCGVFCLSTKSSGLEINIPGLSVALLSALSYALYIILVNRSGINLPGITITFYSLLFSCLFYLLKMLISGQVLTIPHAGILLHIALFGLVTSVISITALIYAIKLIGSTPTAIMGALEPVIAVGVSVYLFREKLSHSLIAGIVLILTGVIVDIVVDARIKRKIKAESKVALP